MILRHNLRLMIFLLAVFLALPQPTAKASSPVEFRQTGTYPELWINGKPFFIHAAHFFYQRIPRDLWESSLKTYKEMGINTVDFYIPWNWHEPQPGQLDFDGHSNPRKDVIGFLKIISNLGLKAVIRPGPYICAEWKNGGYPDWLLKRPEYKMANRSILEGRYPPLSSLQYADSDTAAAGWLENPTHLKYVERWYGDVVSNVLNAYSIQRGGPIILVQLDDDQPAGDRTNGLHFWKYMKTLRDLFARKGISLPMVLNPEESAVPALGDESVGLPHLWVMDQWYQRYSGLDLSTSSIMDIESRVQSLKTSPEFPPSMVEFNSGFFGLEDDPYGMGTDPSNTLTASRILIQKGLKGIFYFPLQDSLYPAGYEIPSTGRYYAWESPLDVVGKRGRKAEQVERNGDMVRIYGELLASAHEWADSGIIVPFHSMDFIHLSTGAIAAVQAGILDAERQLIKKQISSDWVDPQAQPIEQLTRYPVLILPDTFGAALPWLSGKTRAKLLEYEKRGGKLMRWESLADSAKEQSLEPLISGRMLKTGRWIYGSELVSDSGSLPFGKRDSNAENYGMVFLTNLSADPVKTDISAADPYNAQAGIALNSVTVAPKDSLALPLRIKLSRLLHRPFPFISDTDEIYYATAELKAIDAGINYVRMSLYSPAASELSLQLKQTPFFVALDHKKFSDYVVDSSSHRMIFRLPAGRGPDHLLALELFYSDKQRPDVPARQQAQPLCEFPTRIDYLIRPDVVLPSSPVLARVQMGRKNILPVVFRNPSDKSMTFPVRWEPEPGGLVLTPREAVISLAPRKSKRLDFEVSPPEHGDYDYGASLVVQSSGMRQEIPFRLLWMPPHQVADYPFDLDRDGNQEYLLENDGLRVAIDFAAGGRIVQMVSKADGANIAAPAGLSRDMFTMMDPLDTAWGDEKLPGWTRSRAPGFKTRTYKLEKIGHETKGTSVTLFYHAPDVPHHGADIRKTFTLAADESSVVVHYEVRVSSGDPKQEFRVHDVVFLDPHAELWYSENGNLRKESLNKDMKKNFRADWIGIRNSGADWVVAWLRAASVSLSIKGDYAVVEAGLGDLPDEKPRLYDLRYDYGPGVLNRLIRRKHR